MFLNMENKQRTKTAVIDNTYHKMSYGDLCDFSEEFGEKVEPRSIVFVMCENCIGALAGYIGCMNKKAVPLLLNAGMDKSLLDSLLQTYTPAYIWLPENMLEIFHDFVRLYEKHGYYLLKTQNEIYPLYEDLSMLLTTSGSTGSPKLVRHSYLNPEVNAKNVSTFFGFTSEDRGMADLPMQYTMGLSVICSHLYVGATVLLFQGSLMSSEFWDFFKGERATDFTGVPFSYDVFLKLGFLNMDLPDLRIISEGGGKLTDDTFQKLVKYAENTGKKFYATFGTTETTARLAYLPPELASQKTGSIGRAIPDGELFLLDEKGSEISGYDVEGEMGYRGPNVTLGYALCKEDLCKGDERKGVYLTGDIARRDKDNCYYIVGRKSRFLKLFGLRVNLDQCERLIKDEFKVECACSGNDEYMHIFINDNTITDKVTNFISVKTKIYKSAFKSHYIEKIPRNESGKILYSKLEF